MDDELRPFADNRPAAPPYPPEAREAARHRLLSEAAGRRRFRRPRLGWQAVGAFGLTVALVGGLGVALSSRTAPVAVPGATATDPASESEESVAVAPSQDAAEPLPKPGQYILVESETMYTSESMGEGGTQSRYLYRTKRKIWKPVDGNSKGLLWSAGLAPKQWPGWPLPEEAKQWRGEGWSEISGHCPGWPEDTRTDYAYLSTLPTDEAGMREYLYNRPHGDIPADDGAFGTAGDLLRENYLPRAQRQALFEATKTIPGVVVTVGVKDSAGREGVALGRPRNGIATMLIFDPETYMFLGERGTVVDEKAAGAPVGSVMALTAQLKVSVTDELPQAEGASKDSSCEMQEQLPTPTPTGAELTTPTPTPTGAAPTTPPPTS
ncbi:CU044_5270 family protein [Sphaerisporangium sp. NBC_01403]|uniref:CU044_5270 family protein n=1 Tax=Sphaerisporangium sp. NBC_01403 TaxID=2903599 RepID=UPI003250E56F